MESYANYLIQWLQEEVKKAKCNGLIVGVSGGIDSAVVANLIKRAFPNNSMGLILPCHSNQEDVIDAMIVVDQCQLEYKNINLDATFDTLVNNQIIPNINQSDRFKLSLANTKARLRMTTLYSFAQNYNYLVVGTDNECEWHTGYFTKYGDGGVDLVPLVHLNKAEVYELAKYLNVDQKIIDRIPTAGLIENQSDEDEMQVTYAELNDYLRNKEISKKSQERIEFLHNISEHKRNLAKSPLKKLGDF